MQFITDRTHADVLLGNEKGIYSYEDLNRVERAVAQLSAMGTDLDVYPELTVKTDWLFPGIFSAGQWPVESQMQRYLENVCALCRCFSVSEAGLPADMSHLDHQGANAIEEALQRVYKRVRAITETYKFSGELIAGEEI